MLSTYDLYDLYWILLLIRSQPDYELNGEVVSKVIGVLQDRHERRAHGDNEFRLALRSIDSLDRERYRFAYVDNYYTYCPAELDDEYVYKVLIECFECLSRAIAEKNTAKVDALADCLHNLPTYIAENNLTIPKPFWLWLDNENGYRSEWDDTFLRNCEPYEFSQKRVWKTQNTYYVLFSLPNKRSTYVKLI